MGHALRLALTVHCTRMEQVTRPLRAHKITRLELWPHQLRKNHAIATASGTADYSKTLRRKVDRAQGFDHLLGRGHVFIVITFEPTFDLGNGEKVLLIVERHDAGLHEHRRQWINLVSLL